MAIISFGEALIDLLPADNDSSHCVKCAGGAPANVAVGVAKLGQKSVFIGTLSSDAMGRLLTTELQAVGVELAYSPISSYSTALVLVSLDDCGERSFQFYRHNTADLDFTTKSITAYPFTTGDIIHLCSNTSTLPANHNATLLGLMAIQQTGALISLDVNLRENLWPAEQVQYLPERVGDLMILADILKFSKEEYAHLETVIPNFTTIINDNIANGAVILITDGANPITVMNRSVDNLQITPFMPQKVVDTTGAGDGFISGFLSYCSNHKITSTQSFDADTLFKAVKFASQIGAKTCEKKGAFNALPYLSEL